MKPIKSLAFVAVAVLLGFSVRQAVAGQPDAWITTRARIALLTTDGAGRNSVKVDTDNGRVTLHGTVGTEAQREAASTAVEALEGTTPTLALRLEAIEAAYVCAGVRHVASKTKLARSSPYWRSLGSGVVARSAEQPVARPRRAMNGVPSIGPVRWIEIGHSIGAQLPRSLEWS
jgi:hypothetical protein